MTRHRSLAVALTAALSFGCTTTAAFRQGSPVDLEKGPLVNKYRQDGVLLKTDSLLDGLEFTEVSKPEAKVAKLWTAGGQVLGAGAGLCLGYGAIAAYDGKSSGWPLIGGGVLLLAGGVWAATVGDRHTTAAVEVYNASLASPPAPKVSWQPYVTPLASATPQGKASGAEAGMVLRF
jgi:hypothetical protein